MTKQAMMTSEFRPSEFAMVPAQEGKPHIFVAENLFGATKRDVEEIHAAIGVMMLCSDCHFMVPIKDRAAFEAYMQFAEEDGEELEASVGRDVPETSSAAGSACMMAALQLIPMPLSAPFWIRIEHAAWPPKNVLFAFEEPGK